MFYTLVSGLGYSIQPICRTIMAVEEVSLCRSGRTSTTVICVNSRGVTKGGTIPRAPNNYGGAESLRGSQNYCGGGRKAPTMSQVLSSVQCICFRKTSGSTVGGAKLAYWPSRHLTSLRPIVTIRFSQPRT